MGRESTARQIASNNQQQLKNYGTPPENAQPIKTENKVDIKVDMLGLNEAQDQKETKSQIMSKIISSMTNPSINTNYEKRTYEEKQSLQQIQINIIEEGKFKADSTNDKTVLKEQDSILKQIGEAQKQVSESIIANTVVTLITSIEILGLMSGKIKLPVKTIPKGITKGTSKTEKHHIATDKSKKFDFKNHPAFKETGINVSKDIDNLVDLANHRGRHTNTYHKEIQRRLDAVYDRYGGTDKLESGVRNELQKMKQELLDGTLDPYGK